MPTRERLTWRDWVFIGILGMVAFSILWSIAGALGWVPAWTPVPPERPWIR